jgi:subtilisin-like proprotein convertase family protein
VSLDKVQTLINLSFQSSTPTPSGDEKTFEFTTATAVPDADTNGVTVDLPVSEAFSFTALSVSVDIEHTWRGDLTVKLLKDGAEVQTLAEKTGGSAHNLTQTWTFQPSQVGGDQASGTWGLKVIDDASADEGTLKLFKLAFATAE